MTVAHDYDALLLDLDGTVYEGGRPIDSAVAAILDAHLPSMFVTNNASRHPRVVAEQLQSFGLPASEKDVMTSAQAAVGLIEKHADPGATVLVIGTESFRELVEAAGYIVTDTADDHPAVVVHGHNPDTGWRELSEAALALRQGAVYLASNRDATLPKERGEMVGNGSMIMAVVSATGVDPESAGKPGPTMFWQAQKKLGCTKPLAVGDRLDTDIAGGNAAGFDTLEVLTGVSGPQALLEAPENCRPTLIAVTLRALNDKNTNDLRPGNHLGFTATVQGGVVSLSHDGSDLGKIDDDDVFLAGLLTVLGQAWKCKPGAVKEVTGSAQLPPVDLVLRRWH